MSREFKISREFETTATPEQVWDAVTTGTAAWLWPMEVEPRLGGAAAMGGTVTAWDPPHHFTTHVEGPDGFFNTLENVIEARTGGGAVVRYVHSGIFTDDWDSQYDGAGKHTDFYLHTLGTYLRHYTGRKATYVQVPGSAASVTPDGMEKLGHAIGLADTATVGDKVRLEIAGVPALDAVVDYRTPHFLGLRDEHGMYRFFGRNAWGAPVAVSLHLFADGADTIDADKTEQAWSAWLDGVYA